MFKQNSSKMNEPSAGENLLSNPSRFQVAKVDGDHHGSDHHLESCQNLLPGSNQASYNAYDSRRGQLTTEVPPRDEHYRERTSVQYAYRPTLEELHGGDVRQKTEIKVGAEPERKKGKVIKFGWLEGVFMRCLLNIWGVMLFLRLSWVIGQAGVGEGSAIICLANVVTLLTTISMSAVSTNGQIKGGGIYYMISRSLGPEFGGAIGLMFTLANSIAVSMYIVGFCESLQDLLRSFGMTLIDGATNDVRVVGIITLILILVLAIIGMDWVTRTQMLLLVVLVASQVDFIIGSIIGPTNDEDRAKGFVGYNVETFKSNMGAKYQAFEGVDHDFFSVFAVFFPAVTGIVAGANLSGDLKDPSSAIPIGTLLAIFVTFVSYIGYGIMLGGCALRDASGNLTEYMAGVEAGTPFALVSNCTGRECKFGLHNDNQAMELVSSWGPLIYGGCFAATLSSAIASLVGAPRVLQALAKDRLYPFIGFFGEGYGANNDPVRGYVLVFIISFGCILIAQLNAIAPLLSNFFLAAYALINFSVFHASISKTPGWRPAFKYYNAWMSLVGTLLCIVVMFLMSWVMALITFVVVVTLYLYVAYRKPDVNWGSSSQAHSYFSALKSLQELNQVEEHVKNYRPQILVLSGMPAHRPSLVHFANLITKGKSLLICGQILKGRNSQKVHDAFTKKANNWLIRHNVKGFFTLAEDDNFEVATQALMQIIGLGKLRPNMILMGYKADWQSCDRESLKQYFNQIHNALDRHLAIGIVRVPEGFDYSEVIYDEDFAVPISSLNQSGAQEEIKRSVSLGQLAQEECTEIETPPTTPTMENKDIDKPQETVTFLSEADKKKKKKEKAVISYFGRDGKPLQKAVVDKIMQFKQKQKKGFIDVWWLYDDGGLTLLIPYILSCRSTFAECKLRIFSLANKKEDLDRDQRNLAALLSKFRIDYSDVILIPDITKKAKDETKKEFESLISGFRVGDGDTSALSEGTYITDSELATLKEKTNRHMRLRELLLQHSYNSTFVVMALPIPRKGVVSAPLYMAWLELLTKGLPPYLIVRGNQTSVITFYS